MSNEEEPSNVIDLTKAIDAKKFLDELGLGEDFSLDAVDNIAKESADLQQMNKEIALVKNYGGRPMILTEYYNQVIKRKEWVFQTPDAMCTNYGDKEIGIGTKYYPIGKFWLKWKNRRIYDSVFFDPSSPQEQDDSFNLWRGIALQPKKGSWKQMRKHIWDICSNKDKAKFIYFIKWMAWAVQNPGERSEVALILKGNQGSGKGIVFRELTKIFGEYGRQISDMRQIFGQFSGHLAHTCLLYIDEAQIKDESMGIFKAMLTEPVLSIEAKFMPLITTKNCLHVVMSTNEKLVAITTDDSRRYYINAMDNRYAHSQDTANNIKAKLYFDRIYREISTGGTEAMYYDLLHINLKGWHPRNNIPKTEESRTQTEMSDSTADKAILHLMDEGVFPGKKTSKGIYVTNIKNIRDQIEIAVPKIKNTSDNLIGVALKEFGCTKVRSSNGSLWEFPDLYDMRHKYCTKRQYIMEERFTAPHDWILSDPGF